MDKTVTEEQLPLRLAGYGHCFRTEAGAAGAAGELGLTCTGRSLMYRLTEAGAGGAAGELRLTRTGRSFMYRRTEAGAAGAAGELRLTRSGRSFMYTNNIPYDGVLLKSYAAEKAGDITGRHSSQGHTKGHTPGHSRGCDCSKGDVHPLIPSLVSWPCGSSILQTHWCCTAAAASPVLSLTSTVLPPSLTSSCCSHP